MMGKGWKRLGWVSIAFLLMGALSTTAFAQTCNEGSPRTVNINRATAEEINQAVPLIPLGLAEKIVQFRQEMGSLKSLEELLQIDGFDQNLFEKVKPHLLLEGEGIGECTS